MPGTHRTRVSSADLSRGAGLADGCMRAFCGVYKVHISWPRARPGNPYSSNVHPSLGSIALGLPHIILQLLLKQ